MFKPKNVERKNPERRPKKPKSEMRVTSFTLLNADEQKLVEKYVGSLYPSFSELVRSMLDHWLSRFFAVDRNGETLSEYLSKLIVHILTPIDLEQYQLPHYASKRASRIERRRAKLEKPKPKHRIRTVNIQDKYLEILDPIVKVVRACGFTDVSRSLLFRNLLHKWLLWKESIMQNIEDTKELLLDDKVLKKYVRNFRKEYNNKKRKERLLQLPEQIKEEKPSEMPIFKITDENRHLFEDVKKDVKKEKTEVIDQIVNNKKDMPFL